MSKIEIAVSKIEIAVSKIEIAVTLLGHRIYGSAQILDLVFLQLIKNLESRDQN